MNPMSNKNNAVDGQKGIENLDVLPRAESEGNICDFCHREITEVHPPAGYLKLWLEWSDKLWLDHYLCPECIDEVKSEVEIPRRVKLVTCVRCGGKVRWMAVDDDAPPAGHIALGDLPGIGKTVDKSIERELIEWSICFTCYPSVLRGIVEAWERVRGEGQ